MNRRELLKGLVAAPIAATILPELLADDGVALLSTSHLEVAPSAGMITTGSIPKLLQEGIHKLMTEQYGKHDFGGQSMERFFYPSRRLFSDVIDG